MFRRLRAIALLALAAGTAASAQQAAQTPTFRSSATLVPVDVKVLDSKGQPILDLRQDEFIVLEDGVRQPLKHFSATGVATGAAPGAPVKLRAASAAGVLQPQISRVFLFVMGRGRLQPPSKGVDAAIQFARERALPQDQLAVFAWNRATDFTPDHEAIATVLERFRSGHEQIEADLTQFFRGLQVVYGSKTIPASIQYEIDHVFDTPGVAAHSVVSDPDTGTSSSPDARKRLDALLDKEINTARDAAARDSGVFQKRMTDGVDPVASMMLEAGFDEYSKNIVAVGQDVAAIYAGIEYLRFIDGEKHLVFVTETGIALPRFDDDIAIARAATDARVAIDVIQTGGASSDGLVTAGGGIPPVTFDALFKAQSIRALAELTGGVASLYDYASNGLRKVDVATRFGYLLAYEAPTTEADRTYHHVEIKVTRPGAKVLYRHGYTSNVPAPSADRREMMSYVRMAQAASVGVDVHDIKLSFEAGEENTSSGNALALRLTIGINKIGFTADANARRAVIDIAVLCSNRDGEVAGQKSQRLNIVLTDAQFTRALATGVNTELRVPMGKQHAAKIKVIAYDFNADVLGSVTKIIR